MAFGKRCWSLCVDMLVFLLGGEYGGTRLSVLVVLCLAWWNVSQPSSWFMSKGRIFCPMWKYSQLERRKEQHWLPRWVCWLKFKKPKYVGGSKRGELFSKQIPKADDARRLYWGEMPSALTPKALGDLGELVAVNYQQPWPCSSRAAFCCTSLFICSYPGAKTQFLLERGMQISDQTVHLAAFEQLLKLSWRYQSVSISGEWPAHRLFPLSQSNLVLTESTIFAKVGPKKEHLERSNRFWIALLC